MQFKVPQFLEIEDKIFGPFTFKQFAYLAGGGGLCFVIYKALGLTLGMIPILLVAGFALLLTFYRPNNKPFIYMVQAGFKYFFQSKLYIWKKATLEQEQKKEELIAPEIREVRLSGSKLRDLAWSLDILDLQKNQK